MDTKNYIDIDRHIEDARADMHSDMGVDERRAAESVLARLIAERDETFAQWRAGPEWERVPF